MTTKPSLLELLRKQSSMYMRDLPDGVRIPALDGSRRDDVTRPVLEATIDDIAFAIQGLEAEASAIHRRLGALRDLYEMARKRGALGITPVSAAFAHLTTEEASQ
jgi:hypothetical protein